ncbi:wax ester/triacylglycerol synthase family O-acyltransferase [Ferrimonas sp. SCSIO 43195]|uniref:wax ester/triacylglycerol synthase family O-acyltransferase n=1 Tax=Ferrimonas sp. SCSIO 43195 TaxID=2822844 RepID=UPI0020761130|nr:wax ester/triacylglycerol synthase family O-acyltransferase [Ferrimonas sp. SCSIO 43195]USD36640.1 wax ester/triacylglycerol synthase family O-acyltransferase [Ferrimonas sp. SCSIO 43195]
MARLSLIDASFVLFESAHTPMHVGGLFMLEPDDRNFATELFQHLLQCHIANPPFNRILKVGAGGWPYWKTTSSLNIEQHVFLHQAPQQGDELALQRMLAQLHSQLMDRRKPLWECHIVEGIKGGQVALYIKIHHACADGMKLSAMVDQLLSKVPDTNISPAFWQFNSPRRARQNNTLKQAYDFGSALYHQIVELPNLAKLTGKLFSRAFYPTISRMPIPFTAEKTFFNQRPINDRVIAQGSLPISSIKRISKFTGASVNEVVLAVCDAALHQYLIDHKRPSDKPLVAIMPVNMKVDANDKDNHFSPALIELGKRQNQPTERLKEIMISSRQIKHEAKAFSPTAFMNLSVATNALMLLIGKLKLDNRLPTISNLVISNVPGPRETRYLFGAPIRSITPYSVLLPDQSLNITLFSYDQMLHVGITACERALGDIELLVPYISKALTALELDLLSVTLEKVEAQLEQQRH